MQIVLIGDLVDIDSGHWPMVTKPAELARLLAADA